MFSVKFKFDSAPQNHKIPNLFKLFATTKLQQIVGACSGSYNVKEMSQIYRNDYGANMRLKWNLEIIV